MGRGEPAQLDPRRVVAALGNDERRQVFAAAVLDVPADLPPRRLAKALRELKAAGLLDADGHVVEAAFVIAEPVRHPLHPFVADGHIVHFPVKWERTLEVLQWVVTTLPDRTMTEREINEHLAHRTEDVALLRRHLVDAGLVTRTTDGRSYEIALANL